MLQLVIHRKAFTVTPGVSTSYDIVRPVFLHNRRYKRIQCGIYSARSYSYAREKGAKKMIGNSRWV